MRVADIRFSGMCPVKGGRIIMSPPSPRSALCTANEVAAPMEAGSRAESFVNANGSNWSKPLAAVMSARSLRSTESC